MFKKISIYMIYILIFVAIISINLSILTLFQLNLAQKIHIIITQINIFLVLIALSTTKSLKHKIIDLVKISLFCSLAIISRCLMQFIPNVNPFLSIIILSSAYMNRKHGFIIGSLSIFISNIFLGQGLWTFWQMLAAGIIGYLSGLIFNDKKIKLSVLKLALFYILSVIFIYCLIMNFYSILLLINDLNPKIIFIYIISSFTFDTINAVISSIFVCVLYKPINSIVNLDNYSFKNCS